VLGPVVNAGNGLSTSFRTAERDARIGSAVRSSPSVRPLMIKSVRYRLLIVATNSARSMSAMRLRPNAERAGPIARLSCVVDDRAGRMTVNLLCRRGFRCRAMVRARPWFPTRSIRLASLAGELGVKISRSHRPDLAWRLCPSSPDTSHGACYPAAAAAGRRCNWLSSGPGRLLPASMRLVTRK